MNTNPELPLDPKFPATDAPDPETSSHQFPGPEAPTTYTLAAESPDLLDDVEYFLYQASTGKRFANLLIDTVIYCFAWRFVLAYWFFEILIWIHFPLTSKTEIYIVAYAGALLFFGLITAGFEIATGGKTIGKFVTSTRAVMDNGARLTPKAAILRFLARQVPFESFSALGHPCFPWHDRWTKTIVIDAKLTTLPPEE